MENLRKEIEKMKKSKNDNNAPPPTPSSHIHKELSLQYEINEKLEKENESLKNEMKSLKVELNKRNISSNWRTETRPRPLPQLQLQNTNFQNSNYYQVLANPAPHLYPYQYSAIQQKNSRISPQVSQQHQHHITSKSHNNHRTASAINQSTSPNTNNTTTIQENTIANTTQNPTNLVINNQHVILLGDSMIKNIKGYRLSKNKKVNAVSISGATSEDIKDYIKPLVKKKPAEIIIHCNKGDDDIVPVS